MTMETILKVTGCASQRDLAKKLGVSQNCIWQWTKRGLISADGAIAIEKLSKGKLQAHKLRYEFGT